MQRTEKNMDAAMVGEAFLGAVVGVLVERLASLEFIDFFRDRKHDDRLRKKLEKTMVELNKVLNDAENKQFTDQSVKLWLEEVKDAVYDVEDLVDEIATEDLRSKVEADYPRGKKRFRDNSLISTFARFFDSGGTKYSKLEEMIGELDQFVRKAKDVHGLREVAGQYWSRLPSTSVVDGSCVYGRENDKEEIMKLLLCDGESSNRLDVIPIVGMGGVGKTTLAQLLYNDDRVDAHFAKKAWVCVSDVFDVSRITLAIVEAVSERACDTKDLNLLAVKLKESLRAKKFLIVLDDVWNENCDNWNALRTPFKFGERGSKIIITTRNDGVASIMRTVPIHRLQVLPEEECWELFSQHAFEMGDCNEHPNLERIGKEIVRKCDGLPLAVKTLGGLLRSQRDVKDWNNILESAIWELPDEKSDILPALRLSYHYLPSHLKRCFAFCSVFIKDYEFDMEELVLIWMAQGFLVKPKNNKTAEEVGYEWFHELVSRSFFQRSSAHNSSFVMHDLVHDLAQHVMGDFCYRLEDDKPCGTFENVRHFSYVRRNFDGVDKLRLIKDAKCLRTFLQINDGIYYSLSEMLWLSNKVLDEIILGMPRLRLLSLSQYEFEELPCSIGKLIHLRFLDLSYSRITQLPESVCTLYNLETLLLSKCRSLRTLPADLGKLISLRHLEISGDHPFGTNLKEMPVSISRLKDLQQLTEFVVGKCSGSGINGLKELNSLCGEITISGLENVTSGNDASEAKLKEKKHLNSLTLRWDSSTEDSQKERDVLENLEPHTNLKSLAITNYGGTRFPNWLGDKSFCNMVDLSLCKCENCFSLPPLGQMQSLQKLWLQHCPEIETFPEGGLPSGLTFLLISECEKLKSLPEQLHTLLPSLQELTLWDCPEIKSFPEGGLPSKLCTLHIWNCNKLVGGRRDWGLQTLPSLTNFTLDGESEDVISLVPANNRKNMAATLVGGAFLNSTLNVLFDRLSSREVITFFRGRKHDERLLKKLKLKLLGLNMVLNDAENKQFTDRAVKEWLDELKGAVYDTEDLVDEIATEALRCKVEAEYQSDLNQVQSLFSSSTKLFGDEIESKLERMIDFLEDFMSEKYVLGLREVAGRYWFQTRLPSTSVVVESCVYGREADKEKIMKLLVSDGESSNGLDVIPIVGMGGVGKTTLAQLLYNDDRLDGHFVKKAWVRVSHVFDVLSITRTIVEKVTGLASDGKDLNLLQVMLKESLGGKKFLFVLDDVWNENHEHWDILIIPFKFGARGSKIIVTTRNEKVASIMKTVPIHGLKELPEEDSWMLFSKHAFEKGNCNAHPDLEKIGKEIVKKCKGLPLTAKTLGGLLRSQWDVKEWNNILESAIWELSEQKSNILPALRLSYHYLPSHLKRCFAFCSTFIKDYEFNVKELVSIWMAEGFLVKPKNNKTVEEEGYECFRELLSRSFFQRSNADNSLFVMHDLIHDLAQHVMGDFCYSLADDKPCGTSKNVRHFSYARRNFDGVDKLKVIKDAKCLRTFLQIDHRTGSYASRSEKVWLSNKGLDEIISGMPRLRLLSLPFYEIEELPYSIVKLIHLRFLDLSYSRIAQLPESVCTMYNLETLLLSHCYFLTTLPVDLGKLISLRCLDLSDTSLKEMPVNISRLKDLQRLTDFVVGKCSGSGINGLKELNSLGGAITISGLENVTSGDVALEAKLKEKKHLERLTLEWGSTTEDSQKERDVLENLEPPTNLKELTIYNYGGTRFPNWLGDQPFGNMVSLRLEKCENCFSLPPLGQMPSLQSLWLWDCPKIESFPEGGLPSTLTGLHIRNCKKLKSLPEQIHTLPSLRQLTLWDCPEIKSFPEGGLQRGRRGLARLLTSRL